ncbi:phosphoribosylanthranilate isomerase [Herbiconiux sp. CPCC 205716]|uniref:N-(5'-phosphoribosyl)anthranilate isomerase n=1 Tax=Herbiconiux gentiana TaxID=2970912 RepID=A0ABT2GJF0_9MICO|nr:phosphoribosylanthranilate isomerase [Herbiconiux gentiana]MCS5716288.1 phosphoribosylanthranilate isomerase [Herbiconiux gentiana]
MDAPPLVVKVCGLRTEAAIDTAVAAGADAVGFVIAAGSPRHLDGDTARRLVEHTAGRATTVLVTKGISPEKAAEAAHAAGVDVLQVHGFDRREVGRASALFARVWRATSLDADDLGSWGEELLLIDSPRPGSGERWDLGALRERRPEGPWLLAGGLDPSNVAQAVAEAAPDGVDVSSGVESAPGVKDHALIERFVAEARSASTVR